MRDALAKHRLARCVVVQVHRVGVEGDRGIQQDIGLGDGLAEAGSLADLQVLEVGAGGHCGWRPGAIGGGGGRSGRSGRANQPRGLAGGRWPAAGPAPICRYTRQEVRPCVDG